MTGKSILYLVLLVVLGLAGVAVWQSSTLREYGQARQARAAFAAGVAGRDYCVHADHRRAICLEGFYHHQATEVLKRKDLDLAAWLFEQGQSAEARGELGLWSIAVGLAYGQSDRRLEEWPESMAKDFPFVFGYMLDGWALTYAQRFGMEKTLSECRAAFGEPATRVCLVGIGRATFYDRPADEVERLKNPLVQYGFDFARTFTRFKTDLPLASIVSPGARVAELFKYLLMDRAIENNPMAFMMECLGRKHHVECAPLVEPLHSN